MEKDLPGQAEAQPGRSMDLPQIMEGIVPYAVMCFPSFEIAG